MMPKLIVKKEIRTLGLDLCNPRRLVGAIVRGGVYLDGVIVFPFDPNQESRSIALAILRSRYFPELRLIMTHGPETRLDTKIIDRVTKLPIIQVNSARKRNPNGFRTYTVGRKKVQLKSRLLPRTTQEVLATTWTTGTLPEPLRIAHLLSKSRFFREKHAFSSQQINSSPSPI